MRGLIKAVIVVTGLSCAILGFAADEYLPLPETKTKPNILLIVIDDVGYTDLGAYGSEINTPNINKLARNGVKFTNFNVSVSGSPTRSMLLTGTDNHIAGLGNMAELLTDKQKGKPGYEGYLNHNVVTLAEVLKANGYNTYMAGKWHLGSQEGQYPANRGFDKSFSLLYGGASHWADRIGLYAEETPAKYTKNGQLLEQLPKDFYSSRSYTDFISEAIKSNQDGKPFLAYLALTAPHDPLHVPEPWLSKYRGKYDSGYELLRQKRIMAAEQQGLITKNANAPKAFASLKPWKSLSKQDKKLQSRKMEVYAGMIENVDHQVGRLVQQLKDKGLYDNTIIVLMSDNGGNPWRTVDYPQNQGEQGKKYLQSLDNSLDNIGKPGSGAAYGLGWSLASSGPLNYFKMTSGEGGIRVPLIIAGGVVKQQGGVVDGFAYVTDIMPTLLELTGGDFPQTYNDKTIAPMIGRSLVPVLAGKRQSVYKESDIIAGEMFGNRWVKQGQYKAVYIPKPYGDAQWHLYNIQFDPAESYDLAKTKPQLLQQLKQHWANYAKEVRVVQP